jgi:hypothetical protein
MLLAILKLGSGFLIGRTVGKYIAQNQLSATLGVGLTIALVLLVCTLLDRVFIV